MNKKVNKKETKQMSGIKRLKNKWNHKKLSKSSNGKGVLASSDDFPR